MDTRKLLSHIHHLSNEDLAETILILDSFPNDSSPSRSQLLNLLPIHVKKIIIGIENIEQTITLQQNLKEKKLKKKNLTGVPESEINRAQQITQMLDNEEQLDYEIDAKLFILYEKLQRFARHDGDNETKDVMSMAQAIRNFSEAINEKRKSFNETMDEDTENNAKQRIERKIIKDTQSITLDKEEVLKIAALRATCMDYKTYLKQTIKIKLKEQNKSISPEFNFSSDIPMLAKAAMEGKELSDIKMDYSTTVLLKKYHAVDEIHKKLDHSASHPAPQERLENAKQALKQKSALLNASRDNATDIFLKVVASIFAIPLTLGIAIPFIWTKPKDEKMAKQMRKEFGLDQKKSKR